MTCGWDTVSARAKAIMPQKSFLGVHTHPSSPQELGSCPGPWNVRAGQSFITDISTTIVLLIMAIIFITTVIPILIIIKRFKEFPCLKGICPETNLLSVHSGLDKENFLDPWEGGWREVPMNFWP